MQRQSSAIGLAATGALLLATLYPAVFLGQRVAPEEALRSVAPWRLQWGPHPAPSAEALAVATSLGPRLAGIARDGFAIAIWNPYIGGGRAGWLSGSREGGAPLPLLAGLLAAPGWAFTALLALEVAAASALAFLVFRRLSCSPWAAAAGAIGYALSGAVGSQLLSAPGTALALGPAAFLPALAPPTTTPGRRVAGWGVAAGLLLASGPGGLPFLVAAILLAAWRAPGGRGRTLLGAALGLGLALAALAPRTHLRSAALEPGAPALPPALSAPVRSLSAFALPVPADPAGGPGSADRRGATTEAFLGLPLLLLAFTGLALGRPSWRWPWAAVTGLAALGTALPATALTAAGLGTRPYGLLALGLAGLAGLGVDRLLEPASVRPAVGVAVCGLLLADLLPATAHHVFYADASLPELESPLAPLTTADGSRAAPLLENMPPDVGATLGISDVRAADLSAEPRYRAALGEGARGTLPVAAALSLGLRELGVRWLIEPLPLRIVSAQIFSAIDAEPVGASGRAGGSLRLAVVVPPGAIRLGLAPPDAATGSPRLVGGRQGRVLRPDPTLAGESDAWRWFALPESWPPGPATLEITPTRATSPASYDLAWDTSDLRPVGETMGARIWRCLRAAPLVSLPAGGGEVFRLTTRPGSVEARLRTPNPAQATVLVKHRPDLWIAEIDGRRVATTAARGVWTAVPVPAGVHELRLRARLPWTVWTLGATGVAAIAFLGLARRSR